MIRRKTQENKWFYVFNTLILVLFSLLIIVPIWNILVSSVSSSSGLASEGLVLWPKGFTIENYRKVLSDSSIPRAFLISVLKTVIGAATHTLFCAVVAYGLSKSRLFAEVNPNVVVTIYSGRPLDLNGISQAKAIVQAWMPGTEGGNALAEILWGYYNPSARLSMSFPETVGQVPVFYNSDSTGRPYDSAPNEKYVSKYLDVGNDPKYPFGFGLSYTQFAYSNLQVEQIWFDAQTPLKISVSVKNEGSMPGEETVQLYIRDLIGEVVRPVKELKDFKKIWLEPNEEKLVRFELTEAMVRYVHSDQKRRSEGGKFTIMVGGNSRDVLIVPAELNE
ncbi:hypothetical protein EGW35_10885 [Enterococcus durans]|uniref:glycoside hydrolase family 3 C-terminal domain-containing protein n=1 Tax=Enterococcus durans TaxID=53345 RepID=UPI000F4F5B8C|nr:glycoside hydrolase family 3 C-terminal domain-containing protein [Enterococcus durans]NJE63158.1 hypothetical protein [Enterococcus durans]QED59365.1 hypothetical protein FS851_05390 [Enterococcus durans]QED62512.1 hypothetical protein FUT28_08570 [Enterococcus durans]ROX81577.1 hypothetical protein EGW35_10885 [Enterococcus durans]